MSETTPFQEIQTAMAKAFFCCAFAGAAEEAGAGASMGGRDWMDVLPEAIDPAAIHAAETLCHDMLRANLPRLGGSLMGIYDAAYRRANGDCGCTPESFGHYCAMQAMGQGVGLRDAFGAAVYDLIQIPYVEFGSHSLQLDYDFTGL